MSELLDPLVPPQREHVSRPQITLFELATRYFNHSQTPRLQQLRTNCLQSFFTEEAFLDALDEYDAQFQIMDGADMVDAAELCIAEVLFTVGKFGECSVVLTRCLNDLSHSEVTNQNTSAASSAIREWLLFLETAR